MYTGRIGLSYGVPILKAGFRPQSEDSGLLRGLEFILQVELSQMSMKEAGLMFSYMSSSEVLKRKQ